jgi:DNA repair protein RadC
MTRPNGSTETQVSRPPSAEKLKLFPIPLQVLGEFDREVFVVLSLDTKNRVLAVEATSVGSLSSTIVHPREVFKSAILANAAGIIVAHNHPSGDLEPSVDDLQLTDRLKDVGALLGIPLLDHVIIGNGQFYALAHQGRFE